MLTANEIKPGNLSPTLLVNAQKNAALHVGWQRAVYLSLSICLPLALHTTAAIASDRFPAPVCVWRRVWYHVFRDTTAALMLIAAIRPPETVSQSESLAWLMSRARRDK